MDIGQMIESGEIYRCLNCGDFDDDELIPEINRAGYAIYFCSFCGRRVYTLAEYGISIEQERKELEELMGKNNE